MSAAIKTELFHGEKGHILISISCLALIISLASFVVSLRQKKRENIRSLRKQLSDTLNELSTVSVAFAKLKLDTQDNLSSDVIELRRSYNSQRRTLINYADFLINENPQLANETDYILMATNWNSIGNYPKAESYWKLTIEKSDDLVIKHMNLRGYGTFLFFQGNMATGRSKFDEALSLRLPDTENVKRTIADTYLMWARVERDFSFITEYLRLVELSKSSCERISHKKMKQEMQNAIQLFLAEW